MIQLNIIYDLIKIKIFLVVMLMMVILQQGKAEIIIEYKVTPMKDHPFLEELEVLPYKITMTIGDEYVKIEEHRYISFGSQFMIYPLKKKYFFSCISGMGLMNYHKSDRFIYDSINATGEFYSVLGSRCEKILGVKGGRSIEIYATKDYGVSFHPNVLIDGIALLYIVSDDRFEKIIYEAIDIQILDVNDAVFDISKYKKGVISKKKKDYRIGKELRKIKVRSLDGNKVDLNFADGRIDVINFWFKACQPCIREIPMLNKLADSLRSDRINFIAISIDSPKDVANFLRKNAFNYDHYAGGKNAATRYSISGYPTNIIIDQNGKIEYLKSGFSSYTVYQLAETIQKIRDTDSSN